MRRPQLLRFSIALTAEILCCASLNLFDDWTLEEMPVKFVASAMLGGIGFLFAAREFLGVAHAILPLRRQAVVFWTVAVALRLVALPLTPGDDLWRYQWEGKIQQAGFNPYVHAPDDPKLEAIRAEFPEWQKINHRDFRAIYPPGAELLFSGLSRISHRPLFYKLLFTGADLGTIAVLLLLIGARGTGILSGTGRTRCGEHVGRMGVSPIPIGMQAGSPLAAQARGLSHISAYANAAWYAWNPLVVYSFAGAAHFDSLMILPMTAGVLFLTRFEAASDSRRKWFLALAASAAFGIAISVKLVPVLLLLPCVFALGFRAITLVVSVGIPALLSTLYGYPKINIWESLGRFAHVTRLNDLFWWLIEETIWPNPHQKNYHYNVILIICVILVSLLFWRNWKRGMIWAFGTALILSPVLHPWYCAWILPLAAWRRAYAWFVFSVTIFAYFLFWNERLFALPWHAEPWMRAIILVPTLAATFLLSIRRQPVAEESTSA